MCEWRRVQVGVESIPRDVTEANDQIRLYLKARNFALCGPRMCEGIARPQRILSILAVQQSVAEDRLITAGHQISHDGTRGVATYSS